MFNIFKGLTAAAVESDIAEIVENASGALEQATEEAVDMSIKWHPEEFLPNLQYMGKGMLCIFIVIGVIIASIFLINFFVNRFTDPAKKEARKAKKAAKKNSQE